MEKEKLESARRASQDAALQAEFLRTVSDKQRTQIARIVSESASDLRAQWGDEALSAAKGLTTPLAFIDAWTQYIRDATERSALTLDVLRRSSDAHAAHLKAGSPPVLAYDYDLVLDGADLLRPCNYILLKIKPSEGASIDETKRPYVIIDPRAGHGAGIGGFKPDSQIGVALAKGHPVYFVGFRADPEPGQTLADVCEAEATFVAEVERLHPDSKKPVVIGNCQAGWATAIMAATHPEVSGPIVLNGAPMSYWAGNIGRYPMRYSAGVFGGLPLTLMSSDLGGGVFDGASLVFNFEQLNPSRNWFSKYYDLFRDVDKEGTAKRFIDFERWWGAYYMMTDAEIRWIVDQLFVGNYLGKNQAQLDPGVPIDLKKIQSPVICFASEGDNITPPAQAFNWILDTYRDENEIIAHRQRIFYMLNDRVGHLGIFVSSSVAKKEHKGMASVLETIETVPPGLYELSIEDEEREGADPAGDAFVITVSPRTFEELSDITGDRRDERAFAGVARASEAGAEVYDSVFRPAVKAAVPRAAAQAMREVNPMRLRKKAFSTNTPIGMLAKATAPNVAKNRQPVDEDNIFLKTERLWADYVIRWMDTARDIKEAATELAFFSLWASPWALAYGAPKAKSRHHLAAGRVEDMPEVRDALARQDEGGPAAGIARLGLAFVHGRGGVRLGQIERIAAAVRSMAPYKDLDDRERMDILHRQRLIVQFTPDQGLDALPRLIKSQADRKQAETVLRFVFQADEKDVPAAVRSAWEQVLAHIEGPSKRASEPSGKTVSAAE
ncbi:MAG: DUF3141 domain-containing protein [Pseudomonadota bacterium]